MYKRSASTFHGRGLHSLLLLYSTLQAHFTQHDALIIPVHKLLKTRQGDF